MLTVLKRATQIVGLYRGRQVEACLKFAWMVDHLRLNGHPSSGIYTVIVPVADGQPVVFVRDWEEADAEALIAEATKYGHGALTKRRVEKAKAAIEEALALEAQAHSRGEVAHG